MGDFLLILVLAMGLAYPFSLVFEVPFVNLDKIFLAPLSIKNYRKQEETNPKTGDDTIRGDSPPPNYSKIDSNRAAEA